ncbi:hypothetical protein D3C78_1491870 [compost metagenome]
MGFRKQPAVEEHATGDLDLVFVVPGEQFLGNAVAVVVSKQVNRLPDLQMREQCLLQVSLLQKAVGVIERFGRITKAQHVAGNHSISLGQRLPQIMPIPTGGRETVD